MSVARLPALNGANPAVASAAIAALFEAGVSASELRGGAPATLLYSSEAAQCARFAPKRIAEFSAGRLCARRALAEFGITDFPLIANADRSPRWPRTITGSITHTGSFCGAVVAPVAAFGSIGIDAETVGRVTPELHRLIFTEPEAALLASLSDERSARAATILFSAKEAFYKCQYPLTQAWRDFRDVSLEIDSETMEGGTFSVFAAHNTQVTDWGLALPARGRFIIDDGLVLTGIAVRSPRSKTV